MKRCVCETQMPPIMANFKEGQGHQDKYLDTSQEILSFCYKYFKCQGQKEYPCEI